MRFRSFGAERRGAVSVMMAVCAAALLIAGGVLVDLGWIYLRGRQLQGMADLAAISAVQDLGDSQDAASATVAANAWPEPVATQTLMGVYTADATVAPASRFQATTVNPSAAQVTLSSPIPLFFGGLVGSSTLTLRRTATAASAQLTSFTIGSGLLAVQGGVANALLSALAGGQVQLSVMDYNALVGARVDLFQYLAALHTRLSLHGASFSNLLTTQVATPTALSALADVLSSNGDNQAAAAAVALATASAAAGPVKLGALFDLGPYAGEDHVASGSSSGIAVPAMTMASAVLSLAQGQKQVSLDLGAAAAGASDITVQLAIGQRASTSPWLRVTDSDTVVVSTAQLRLYVDARLVPPGSVLNLIGVTSVDAPIYVQVASAQAKLSALHCASDPSTDTVDLSVSPSLGELALGQANTSGLSDFGTPVALTPATLVKLSALQASGSGEVDLGGQNWQTVHFTQADIASGAVKTVASANVAQASVASLFANTRLQVQVAGPGVGVGQGPVAAALAAVLAGAAPGLDSVLGQLEQIGGARLGYADVTVNGLRCHGAALVG